MMHIIFHNYFFTENKSIYFRIENKLFDKYLNQTLIYFCFLHDDVVLCGASMPLL